MTYREGRDPGEVARELHEEAQAAVVAAEIAHQNAVANHALAGFALEHARSVLGHLIELERMKPSELRAAPEVDKDDVTRARAEVEAKVAQLAETRAEVERRYDQKGEALNRLREAQAEVNRLR